MPNWILLTLSGLAATLALLAGYHRHGVSSRAGKILAFVAIFALPVAMMQLGFAAHMDRAKTTEFCVSCHVMQDYGRSLYLNDSSHIPAVHFQNNLVPQKEACYSCHTNYTMFGTLTTKIEGTRHLLVQYLGTPPAPKDIQLYEPYSNRECLHCHTGQRVFEEQSAHRGTPELMGQLLSGQVSCLRCHGRIHDINRLDRAVFWKEPDDAR